MPGHLNPPYEERIEMFNLTAKPKNVTIREYSSAEQAQNGASQEAAATGGTLLPAVMFQQGNRLMLTTAFMIPLIRNRLQVNHAKAKGNVEEVRAASNRPLMNDHVGSVKNYLRSNVGKKYILPPLTLNARQALSVHLASYGSTVSAVTIVIPTNVKLEITDGAHRKSAVDDVIDELSEEMLDTFNRDAVSVMITIEDDMAQIHQDFADASKTKQLPKSQLAAYDRRNPANGIVLDIIDTCSLFKGRIDSTSKSLSVKSNRLFLTNQVRQMVKEMLVGSYALADEIFEEKATHILISSESPQYQADLRKFTAFVEKVTQSIPILREISATPQVGVPSERVADLRAQGWVCLQATGLVVLGRIAHELFKHEIADWEVYVERLGSIDWRKTGPLWQGNIIQGGKMMTQQTPVKGAVSAVKQAISLGKTVGDGPVEMAT
jgi:DNA sulfur modification protein DndB